jgi:dTDP-4-dehydrorhamnose reductase
MNILVLGGAGQLGQCLRKVAVLRGLKSITFPAEGKGNILHVESLTLLFEETRPDYVINCAAYTAVDQAEDDVDRCRSVNKDGALNIARLCLKFGAKLIHISTDFVFDGGRPDLLTEESAAAPINVYGLTKFEGEMEIVKTLPAHYIIRTSWLYAEFGANFVKTMLKLAATRDQLGVIVDQVGTPTYAIDLASAICTIIASGNPAYGLYHYSNEGVASWYDFAKEIFDVSGSQVKVLPIKTSEYVTRAIRPKFSVMDKTKIKSTFNLEIPHWRESLMVCMKELSKT